MKRVNVGTLKAKLSRYLKMVQKGERVVVLDRKRAVAEIVALADAGSVWDRMAREGRCRPGTQDWSTFKPLRLSASIPIEDVLRDVGRESR